jgi:hypothetical protein
MSICTHTHTCMHRRRSSVGCGGASDTEHPSSSHPLLTILTNIRNGGPEDEEDALAVEGGGKSFVSMHGRSSMMRVSGAGCGCGNCGRGC